MESILTFSFTMEKDFKILLCFKSMMKEFEAACSFFL